MANLNFEVKLDSQLDPFPIAYRLKAALRHLFKVWGYDGEISFTCEESSELLDGLAARLGGEASELDGPLEGRILQLVR